MTDTITAITPLPDLDTSTLTDVEPLPPELLVEDPRTPPADTTAGDGEVGVFQQMYIWDCWFLAPLGAVAQDADGAKIIDDSIEYDEASDSWTVTFKGDTDHQAFVITRDELDAASGIGVSGDTDVRVMELAAQKYIQSLSEKNLIAWAGEDPTKLAAVTKLMEIRAKGVQLSHAQVALGNDGQRSQSIDDQLDSLQKDLENLVSAVGDPTFSTWATQYIRGLDGGYECNAFNVLTGTELSLKSRTDINEFLSQLASDQDGATATVSCLTDPRTGKYWYGGSGDSAHVIYVTGFDAAAQTITLTDQNIPEEPFTMSVEDFKSWYSAELEEESNRGISNIVGLNVLELPNTNSSDENSLLLPAGMEGLQVFFESIRA